MVPWRLDGDRAHVTCNQSEAWDSGLIKEFDFPTLAQIARDFLAIPASPPASERVFSRGSDLTTKKRNRISSDFTRYVLCLHDWGVLQPIYDEPDTVEAEELERAQQHEKDAGVRDRELRPSRQF